LGSTNSDNVDQLGNKITTGISNQIKNQAVNKTEGLISFISPNIPLYEMMGSNKAFHL
jgi:hypothetical protein